MQLINMNLINLIPLFPLIGAIYCFAYRDKKPSLLCGVTASVMIFLSFVSAMSAAFVLSGIAPEAGKECALVSHNFTWISAGDLKIGCDLIFDRLTAVMLFVVTFVGLLIHIYSIGYMIHDRDFNRFFSYLNLFVFFMIILVMAKNLILMFVGWEGVGLCSYLLIGFWYQDHTNTIAGNKAFIVNRIGDFGFLLGILLLVWEMGSQGVWSIDFPALKGSAHLLRPEKVTLITLLLFVGAAGKSAQIPLYVWLPDAMQGPTPVSALIHAATMVTAGVYMTARLHFLFSLAPATLAVIAVIGALTALFAATVALAQNDIKRVLAYSTVSQLGYMFLAVGVGAFAAAIFHLFTHAFFKACLFLGAGSVIHGLQGEQDMRKMGGLRGYLPTTYWTYLIAALAISGAPLTAGFFSKDQILWQAYAGPNGSGWLWLSAWITAGLTAFYMFRQFFMVFHGQCRVAEHARAHIHESPHVMTVPLVLLAIGAIFAGWLGPPEFIWGSAWDHWLGPLFAVPKAIHEEPVGQEIFFMLVTLGIAGAGFYLAYLSYCRDATFPERISSWAGGIPYQWLLNKYYIDELYNLLLVRPFTQVSTWLAQIFDLAVIDGIVNGVAERVSGSSLFWRRLQSGNIQHYLLGFLTGTVVILAYYLYR